MEQEIKFIALPRESDLRRMLEDRGQADKYADRDPSVIQRYRRQLWKLHLAQRSAAVIAVEVMRPHEFRDIKQKRDDRMRAIREQFESECLAVFSETCTKGL